MEEHAAPDMKAVPFGLGADVHAINGKHEPDLSTPADYTAPEDLYRELKKRVLLYHPSEYRDQNYGYDKDIPSCLYKIGYTHKKSCRRRQ